MKPSVDTAGYFEANHGPQGLLTDSNAPHMETARTAATLVGSARTGGSPRSPAGAGTHRSVPGLDLSRTKQAEEPQEAYVTRYGYVSGRRQTNAVPFGDAPRGEMKGVGSAATVPFHYMPPGIDQRDPNADIKNAGFVPFATATREQWDKVHNAAQSSASAGPGAYDVGRAAAHITGHRVQQGVSFVMGEREVLKPFITPAGVDYHAAEQLENYLLRQAPRMPFTTSKRVSMKSKGGPAPFDTREAYEAMQGKHAYSYKFSTAPAHEKPLVNDVATASVPFYGGERLPRRPVNGITFGKAKRVL